jgi:putative transposase
VEEICRKMGISEPTFYRWKKFYAGMGVTEIRRLKQLEDENAKLKRVVADLTLDKAVLQDILRKNGEARRSTRDHIPSAEGLRYCRTTGLQSDRLPSLFTALQVARRSANRAAHSAEGPGSQPVRYGYRRLHVLLLREGYRLNHKRTYRLYREEGLSIRTKTPKCKRAWRYRSGRPAIAAVNHCWAMDFMSDALFDGRPFRLLTVVDCHTRESLAIVPRTNFKAFQVVEVLDRLARVRGKPKTTRCDNGPEFAGRMLDQWAYHNGVEIDFSRPGKPTDNAFCEAFNGRVRAECLNASWFLSMADAIERIEEWRCDYNNDRPTPRSATRRPTSSHDKSNSPRNCLEPGPQNAADPTRLNSLL